MRIACHIAFALTLVAMFSAPSLADPAPGLALGGTSISPTSTYTSLGVIGALSGNVNTSGTLVRLWGDRLTYSFFADGTRVQATSWGHSLSLGYQLIDAGGYETAYAGVDSRSTVLSPLVLNPSEGLHTGLRYEVDAGRTFAGMIHASAIGSYSTPNHDYWSRLEFLAGPADRPWFGPLFTLQGNTDYHGFVSGLALENLRLAKHLGASIALGTQRINASDGVFTGLNLSVIP